jgi:glutathione peroxidase
MTKPTTSIWDYRVKRIDGTETDLHPYEGKALLIVNTASRCGFTPQYKGLERLHEDLGERGLRVLGFPCNQFGHQEPGDEEEIKNFCSLTYDVKFDLFAKVDVNGKDAHPLFEHLKEAAPGLLGTRAIKWNFTKFLVAPDGRVVERFGPKTAPEELRAPIESVLPRG